MSKELTRSFIVTWISQTLVIFSVVLVVFTAGVITYRETDSLTSFSLIVLCGYVPELLVMPLAGSLVDRLPRRNLLLGCSLLQAAVFTLYLLLLLEDALNLRWLYAVLVLSSMTGGVHRLTYNTSISLFTHDSRAYPRMNGLVQAGLASAHILAPLLAGVLLEFSEGWMVAAVAVLACLLSSISLLWVRFPELTLQQRRQGCRSLARALDYIRSVPGLRLFLFIHAFSNLVRGASIVLFTPFVLAFASEAVLGSMRAAVGVGMAAGALLVSLWGGPARTINGVLWALGCCGLCMMLVGMSRTPLLIGICCFALFVATPILASLAHSIWQCQVPPEIQGRVFGVRDTMAGLALASGYAASPWLAGALFVPLAGSRVAGLGDLYVLLGGLTVLLALLAVRQPEILRLGQGQGLHGGLHPV